MALIQYKQGKIPFLSNEELEKHKKIGESFLANIWNAFLDALANEEENRLFIQCDSNALTLMMIGKKEFNIIAEEAKHCINGWPYRLNTAIKGLINAATITLNFEEQAIYVTTSFANCPQINVYSTDKDTAKIWPQPAGKKVSLCLFEDGGIKMRSSINKNSYFPLPLKMMCHARHNYFNDLLLEEWLRESSKQFPIYKDILRDCSKNAESMKCNLLLTEARNYPSYQHWIQGHYKSCKEAPKSVNKMPLSTAVERALLCRHIKTSERQKIYGMELASAEKENESPLEAYYKELLLKPFTYKGQVMSDYAKRTFLLDYASMSKALKIPISLNFKSFRKVMDTHNGLLNPYMELMAKRAGKRRMSIPKESPFRKLITMPDNWELIKTGKRLFKEGMMMDHCVYGYLQGVNEGTYCIVHMEYHDVPYTMQVKVRRKKIHLRANVRQTRPPCLKRGMGLCAKNAG